MPESIAVKLPAVVTVKQLAETLEQPVTAVIAKLMGFGVLATINEDVDFDTAAIVADDFGITVQREAAVKEGGRQADLVSEDEESAVRPPVVTIMGHVDHGKTTLLDTIRKTNVAAKEAGGITQHISSYQIEVTPKDGGGPRTVTFLDTPGHSAFEAMRRHGARITDQVVLVVAADDGIKPQTVEAINHARGMGVPMLVAINKIDKPDADLDKVKGQLAEHDLTPESWGGNTVTAEVSATKGTNIDELLELVLLATDIRELKANYGVPAVGVVVESNMRPGVGAVATVLVQNGTLRGGDYVAIGDVSGRVRTLTDHRGTKVEAATPSMPVEVSGLSGVPQFGEQLTVYPTEREARDAAKLFVRQATAKRAGGTSLLLQGAGTKEGEKTILNLVVKADTKGSLEAVNDSLLRMKNDDVEVRVVSDGIGDVAEGDVTMARTAKAPVIGFNVRVSAAVKSLADREKITVSLYTVVYELFDEIRAALASLMPMETVETRTGKLQVLARFRDNRKRVVIGGRVEEGVMQPKVAARVMRGEKLIAEGRVVTLRRGKEEARSVATGSECGLELELRGAAADVAVGDEVVLLSFEERRKAFTL